MKVMLLEQKPTTYGIDRQIKTKIVRGGASRRLSLFGFYVLTRMATAIIRQRWQVELKDSRIYDSWDCRIKKRIVTTRIQTVSNSKNLLPQLKKLQELKPREKLIFYDEFAVYDRSSLYYVWAERNSKPEVPSNEKRKRMEVYPNVYVENYNATILSSERANLKLRLRFYFKYLLSISEALVVVDDQIMVIDYRYHFQDGQHNLIFRYDNTPHFPSLSSFPHHKHLTDRVVSANQPSIAMVIQDAIALIMLLESNGIDSRSLHKSDRAIASKFKAL
jgi:hypothetical protein